VLRVTADIPARSTAPDSIAHPLLLYDGVCGLCNRLVQFILKHDCAATFRFASLQSPLATRILARHGADAQDLDTVYVVVNYEESAEFLLARSDAVLFILNQLRGIWWPAAFIFRVIPRPLREWLYRVVARNRYRIFGRYETCPLPREDTRGRFLDL
jgi:predicted DCC family thiol-disulfide oxidoreductase YuxK